MLTLPLLLDVDGPLADFCGHLLALLRYEGLPTCRDEQVDRWSWFNHHLEPHVKDRAYELMADSQFWFGLPLVAGAAEALQAFRDDGHELVFVTSPWGECEGWDWARRLWLHTHAGAGEQHVITTHRKDLVDGLTLIDDRPSNIEAWERRRPERSGVLFKTSQNWDAVHPRHWDWAQLDSMRKMFMEGARHGSKA